MNRTLLTPLALAALAISLAGPAYAVIDVDDYIINMSAAAAADGAAPIADLAHVDEMQFLANSFVSFHDNDASGFISVGDTFDDYIAVRFTGMTDQFSNDITPLFYGSGAGRTHEITTLIKADGHQTSANTYKIDNVYMADMYFDAVAADGGGFTGSNFANISTFADGVLVEHQTLIKGGGVNFDPVLPNGTISLISEIIDDLHNTAGSNGEYYELNADGTPMESMPGLLVNGIVDANNLVDDLVFANAIAAFFGFNPGLQLDVGPAGTEGAFYVGGIDWLGNAVSFGFTTKSDGSFNKGVTPIPEPGTVVLMGLGLIGLAGATYRRRSN